MAKATTRQLSLFAAQLVWTLTGSPASAPSNIQSVELELNGQSWTPRSAPCPEGPRPGPQQTQAAYQCFNPYPSSPASFHYVDRGQSWARCGSETLGQQTLIGQVVPVVGRTGAVSPRQSCDASGSVQGGICGPAACPAPVSSGRIHGGGVAGRKVPGHRHGRQGRRVRRIAVGPGRVVPEHAPAEPAAASPPSAGIATTISGWCRTATSKCCRPPARARSRSRSAGTVSDLSVAPDGVRIAFVAQLAGAPSSGIYLAAIGGGAQSSASWARPPRTCPSGPSRPSGRTSTIRPHSPGTTPTT